MDFNLDFSFNVISILTGIIAWSFVAFFAYRIYKKQIVKPKVWKVMVVILIGLFSFSINWNIFDTIIKFPILPLGVWILYFVFKGKNEKWQNYRAFAWLGFCANFIFLVSTFITIPVHHVIYPKSEPSTYISNIKNASIINIHPSAKERLINKESLVKQLHTMEQEKIYSDQWYEDTYMNTESNKKNERFPYQLIGTSSKWGSGLHAIIYIEDDGKGILVSTSKKQFYFRSEETLIEGGK
ncbi:hypothetical protein [Neobacillus sp. D3-1R]|uniref:hypothetical protein n=1 Tax=Neobacillus sp. D3-1R TaxID=3445778 RepID=UPI003FA100F4